MIELRLVIQPMVSEINADSTLETTADTSNKNEVVIERLVDKQRKFTCTVYKLGHEECQKTPN